MAGVSYTKPSREVMSACIWIERITECGPFTKKPPSLLKLWNPSRFFENFFSFGGLITLSVLCVSHSVFLGDEFASTFLIRHSAQVNAATVGAVETPLHLVCSFSPKKHSGEVMAGMAHIAEALLKAGANPNMQNSKGR